MSRRKVVVGVVVLAMAAFAGGAYAATESNTNPRQAFLNDVAKRLNVSPAQLDSALKGAMIDRLNAAVAAGKLTQARANAIEQRIDEGGGAMGLFLAPRGFMRPARIAAGGPLAAEAKYLGLTGAQLLKQLAQGKSLTQIAKARGKSATGLEQAFTAAYEARLDKAVAAGRITKAQEQQLLNRLSARITRRFNRRLRPGALRGGPRFGPAGPASGYPGSGYPGPASGYPGSGYPGPGPGAGSPGALRAPAPGAYAPGNPSPPGSPPAA